MRSLVFLIEQTAVGLYIIIAVGIFWHWRKWVNARFAQRATGFELERDIARYQGANALTVVVLLIEAGLFISGIQRVVAPSIREGMEMDELVALAPVEENISATSTLAPVSAPLVIDPSGIDLGEPEVAAIFVTPTQTPTRVGTILPTQYPPIGCDTPNATLQIPENGMRVFQPIEVRGTAYIDNFATYKLEIGRDDGSNAFAVFDVSGTAVREVGNLSQFNPAPYPPGTYFIRLMVFDITDTLRASCQVTIFITEPVPTPTPLGG